MFSPCILLIDNDVKLLIKLELAFKRAGYRVLIANNGTQGIYLAQAALPEVIVCNRIAEFDVRTTLAQITDRIHFLSPFNQAARPT